MAEEESQDILVRARALVFAVLLEHPEVHIRRGPERQRSHPGAQPALCVAVELLLLRQDTIWVATVARLRTAIFCFSMYAALRTSLKQY